MQLSTEQIAEFDTRGYIRLDGITELAEIGEIRAKMEQLLASKAGKQEGAFFDMLAPSGETAAMKLVQIKNASYYAPSLLKTQFARNAGALARQVLGPKAKLWFDMLILKPAGSTTDTPWHQDEAFCDPKFEHQEITFWMPLQDVTVQNGCMSFIPGSHKGSVLNHHSPGGDPTVHALECCGEFAAEQAVPCPIVRGGCSAHTGRILHKAGPNNSDQPRFAYILGFHVPPTPSREQRAFPWLAEKRTDDSVLARSWLLRGGILQMIIRKLRRGEMFSLGGLSYGIWRTMSVLFR